MIARSQLPAAERFDRWGFDEVLPVIRKHGLFAVDELLDCPDIAFAAFAQLKEEHERHRALEVNFAEENATASAPSCRPLRPSARRSIIPYSALLCRSFQQARHI